MRACDCAIAGTAGWARRLVAPLSILAMLAVAPGTVRAAERRQPVRSLLELRQERVTLQEFDLSCAAAALATLLNHQHGEQVSEREVALGLISRPDYLEAPELVRLRQGFSLLDLKRYAERRGYVGTGFGRLDFTDLVAAAPLIVPVDLLGFPHFVVFRGTSGDSVLLADPAFGNRTLSIDRFMRAWIEYPGFGRIGFRVDRGDGRPAPNTLAPRADDFLILR